MNQRWTYVRRGKLSWGAVAPDGAPVTRNTTSAAEAQLDADKSGLP